MSQVCCCGVLTSATSTRQVVTGWSLFAAAEPTTIIRARLSSSPWDELAGWSKDPCWKPEDASLDLLPPQSASRMSGGGIRRHPVMTGDDGDDSDGARREGGLGEGEPCGYGLVVGVVPRANFETMEDGLLTSFQLFELEGWNLIALQARRSVGVSGELFVYAILAVGNLLLLNVFVAIVALGFGEAAKDVAQQRARKKAFKEAQAAPPPSAALVAEDEDANKEEENKLDTTRVPLRVMGFASGSKNDPTFRYYMGVFVTSKLFENAILGGCARVFACLAIVIKAPDSPRTLL